MQFIIDYLTSILVGSVVLVILLVTQTSASQKDIDQQMYAAARRHTLAFKLILEKDLPNVGYGVHPSVDPITEWSDSSFAFQRKMDTTPTAPLVTVRYARRQTHTITTDDGATVPVFEVVRFQNGVAAGGATPTLTDYRHEMLALDGSPTTDVGAAVGLRVSYASVFGDRARDLRMNRSRQTLTFYPPNMQPD